MSDRTAMDRAMFDRGFKEGNYCNAYITQDYSETALSFWNLDTMFNDGHVLGFFSSYELHEIDGFLDGQPLRDVVGKLRQEYARWL